MTDHIVNNNIEKAVVGSAKEHDIARTYVCPSCGRQFETALDFCPYDGVRLLATKENSLSRVGAVIGGRYHVDRVLGHGGMGSVFRAIQQPMGRRVAVKVLHPELAQDETFVTRFHTEATAASVLVNPNTVTIYDFGQTEDGTLFIAMEYLEGVSLAEILSRGALPWHHAVFIGMQVCRALSEAHRKRIVHRDLKPENIMLLAADDGSLLVKVLDFGIAKMLEVPGRQMKGVPVTQVGVIIGTPQYMSPEQARGREPSPASDLYALGIILHEAISGAVPFDDDEPILLLGKHMKQTAPKLMSPIGEIPHPLVELIEGLLVKEPSKRPGPTAEVGLALKNVAGDLDIPAIEVIGNKKPSSSFTPLSVVHSVPLDEDEDEEEDDDEDTDEKPSTIRGSRDTDLDELEVTVKGPIDDDNELNATPTAITVPDVSGPAALVQLDDDEPTAPQSYVELEHYHSSSLSDNHEAPVGQEPQLVYSPDIESDTEPISITDEDATKVRSVVVEPTPPEAAGLRPDQILPGICNTVEAQEDTEPMATRQKIRFDHTEFDTDSVPPSLSARGRILVTFLVIIVISSGALTGIFVMQQRERESQGSVADRSLISGSSSLSEGEKSGDQLGISPSSLVDASVQSEEADIEQQDTHSKGISARKAKRPEVESFRVTTPPEKDSSPPASEKTQLSTVRFRTNPPGASVFYESDEICKTTPCAVQLPAGKLLKVSIEKRGYKRRSRMIIPGKTNVLRIKLRRSATKRKSTGNAERKSLPLWLD